LGGQLVGDQRVGDAVVAVDAGDLLDQIGPSGQAGPDVQPVIGHHDVQHVAALRHRELQRAQDAHDLVLGDGETEMARHLRHGQVYGDGLGGQRVSVNDARRNRAPCHLAHQFDAAAQTALGHRRVHAATEAQPRFAAHLLALHGAADVDEVPGRRLQQDVRRRRALGHRLAIGDLAFFRQLYAGRAERLAAHRQRVPDFALQPAHDAADAQRASRVSDQDVEVVQRMVAAPAGG